MIFPAACERGLWDRQNEGKIRRLVANPAASFAPPSSAWMLAELALAAAGFMRCGLIGRTLHC